MRLEIGVGSSRSETDDFVLIETFDHEILTELPDALTADPTSSDVYGRMRRVPEADGSAASSLLLPGGSTLAPDARLVFVILFPVPPKLADEFDEWFLAEHVPLLLKVDAWLSGSLLRTSDPQFTRIALHALQSETALTSDERRAAGETDRSRAIFADPWPDAAALFSRLTTSGATALQLNFPDSLRVRRSGFADLEGAGAAPVPVALPPVRHEYEHWSYPLAAWPYIFRSHADSLIPLSRARPAPGVELVCATSAR